jgi:hypothetical protein
LTANLLTAICPDKKLLTLPTLEMYLSVKGSALLCCRF